MPRFTELHHAHPGTDPLHPLVLGCTAGRPPAPGTPPLVVANDNRTATGTLRDGVLTLDLDAVVGRWYPETEDGPFVDVPAFAEPGKAPTIPTPLIRVPVGTRVRLVIRNRLGTSAIGPWGPCITTTNGTSGEGLFVMRVGQPERLRFEDIQPEWNATFELVRDSVPAVWRPVAKDGFALPAAQAIAGRPDGRSFPARHSMRSSCRRRRARISCG